MHSKSVKKCHDSFCKNYTRKSIESTRKVLTSTLKMFTLAIAKLEKKKNKTSFEIENIKRAKKDKDEFTKKMKEQFSNAKMKKTKEYSEKFCIQTYCNPDCKNTLFDESSKTKTKHIYQGRKHILKDGFYFDLDSKKVEKIRKEGAISGCAKMI
jgi:hypothetical protein